MLQRLVQRRRSSGVEMQPTGGAHARVWAPACQRVDLLLVRGPSEVTTPLEPEGDGFYSGVIDDAQPGDRYWFVLDRLRRRPDPASRFQPDGPHGPSMIVDPLSFAWTDDGFRGLSPEGQVVYELHVGTFTPDGTWAAAARELGYLSDLGVTAVEVMPIADFPGRFGWGYDGVDLYAPTRLYGRPDDVRAFVNRAHAVGLGVILDVVYNHFGPDGNYLAEFSPDYFTDRYENDWGRAINFETAPPVRQFFVENAAYWIEEFHLDGLRLDATQDVKDASAVHVLADIVRAARAAAPEKTLYIVAENEPQNTAIVRPSEAGGFGANALWNDDYHHTVFVALTGRREAYYTDYLGSVQELISCARFGFLYQGQWYSWQKQRRGGPALDLPGHAFVSYLENHDQVANSAFGSRLHRLTSPGRLRALTAVTLLGPATPMLFQGQEFHSSAPFVFFADHQGELGKAVEAGRREFLAQFPSLASPETKAVLPPPGDERTFQQSKLDLSERGRHLEALALHRDLIALRRGDPVIRRAASVRPEGAALGSEAFVLRYFGGADGDRLLVVNLGADLDLCPVAEPLLAPPADSRWSLQWSSESPEYGGQGTPPLRIHAKPCLPGQSAILLRSEPGPIQEEDAP
jgi:maltooligosyltrehalose trehalohydrolase